MKKEMMQEMTTGVRKPIMLLRQEFFTNLTNLINNSGLPLFCIEPILRDTLNGVSVELEKQYRIEKMQYEKALEDISGEQNEGRKISEEVKED